MPVDTEVRSELNECEMIFLLFLQEVDLTHGRVEAVPTNLTRFTNMRSLCLRQNLLTEIKHLDAASIAVTLTQLDLYDNQITRIDGLDALVNLECVARSHLLALIPYSHRHLDLSYNRLRKIENLGALKKLRVLYLVHNKIRRIEGLEGNLELELLELGARIISPALLNVSLCAGDNRIRKLESVNHLSKLRQLYVGKNKITKIDGIDKLTNLHTLSLPVHMSSA